MTLSRSRMSLLVTVVAFATIIGGILASLALRGALPHVHAAQADSTHVHINCVTTKMCLDVAESDQAFGTYVGHDEPANLFYSNNSGAGNQMRWQLRLPSDPPISTAESFNFQLHPAFWFGMAMCDDQSDPNPGLACTPDSDSNIADSVNPNASDFIGNHPGTAFMEMQFYPPGWVKWPAAVAVGGTSCDPTRWCAALNIDSLSRNALTGQENNPACLAAVGLEYINFAFITKNGVSTGPASPLLSTVNGTFTPDPTRDLFMNSGDTIQVTMHDTVGTTATNGGLEIDLNDTSTGETGSMTASIDNGFAEVKFDPNGTNCDPATHNIPTNFHPMYSTSSPHTRVPWAAHSFNIAFSDEIGHFDNCTGHKPVPATEFGVNPITGAPISCPAGDKEGISTDLEPSERLTAGGDDNFCFPASRSSLVQVSGCTDSNFGFDGVPYKLLWPDGNPDHPTPIQFSSPLTGAGFDENYTQSAFETDLPDLESSCNVVTPNARHSSCTLIPTTDDGRPADFYPFYSTPGSGPCLWQIGGAIPNSNLFGQNAQYGSLLPQLHLVTGGHGATIVVFPDFNGTLNNPCPAVG